LGQGGTYPPDSLVALQIQNLAEKIFQALKMPICGDEGADGAMTSQNVWGRMAPGHFQVFQTRGDPGVTKLNHN